jgi:flavin reductase (DIM6/NTAB) family NADH-FMN oxidoreductase RutF
MAPLAVHPWAFKQAMRTLVGGVTIIAARTPGGEYAGLTATAVTSLSAEPPSLIVCLNRSASLAPVITEGTLFSVNILTAEQEEAARTFGGMTGARGAARFVAGNWHRGDAEVPFLVDARASLECRAVEVLARYTHNIVIANVVDIRLARPGEPALASEDGIIIPFGGRAAGRA